MEKETALEIEITKIDDNYSYCKIMYQNKNILKFQYIIFWEFNLLCKKWVPKFLYWIR